MNRLTAMTGESRLGGLIEAFVNKVSHPRGRVLNLMARASVTVPQVILLNFALTSPDSTPSSLAAKMRMSRPSVSQMVDRLVRLRLVARQKTRRTAVARPSASRRKAEACSPVSPLSARRNFVQAQRAFQPRREPG